MALAPIKLGPHADEHALESARIRMRAAFCDDAKLAAFFAGQWRRFGTAELANMIDFARSMAIVGIEPTDGTKLPPWVR